jgi:hypothetical protein
VNLTSRLESLTKQLGCGILMSGEVAKDLSKDLIDFVRPLGTFAVKGKKDPVQLFEVFATDPERLVLHKQETRAQFQEALDLFRLGKWEASAEIFWRISQLETDDGAAHWWLGRIERESSGEFPRSEDGVVKLLEK